MDNLFIASGKMRRNIDGGGKCCSAPNYVIDRRNTVSYTRQRSTNEINHIPPEEKKTEAQARLFSPNVVAERQDRPAPATGKGPQALDGIKNRGICSFTQTAVASA